MVSIRENQIPKLAYTLPYADCNSTLSCLDVQIRFRKHRDRHTPKFDHWVAKRNALHKAGQHEAVEQAQKWVSQYLEDVRARLLQGQLQPIQPAVAV